MVAPQECLLSATHQLHPQQAAHSKVSHSLALEEKRMVMKMLPCQYWHDACFRIHLRPVCSCVQISFRRLSQYFSKSISFFFLVGATLLKRLLTEVGGFDVNADKSLWTSAVFAELAWGIRTVIKTIHNWDCTVFWPCFVWMEPYSCHGGGRQIALFKKILLSILFITQNSRWFLLETNTRDCNANTY